METRLKEVFAFVNNKGGVAKTTSVQNVAAGMLRKNPALRILVIDLDPQCNLSSLMNWSSYQDDITVYDSLIAADADPLPDLHVYQSEPGLYFLPASPKLADIERALNAQMQPKLALSTILGFPLHLHSNTQGATTQGAPRFRRRATPPPLPRGLLRLHPYRLPPCSLHPYLQRPCCSHSHPYPRRTRSLIRRWYRQYA